MMLCRIFLLICCLAAAGAGTGWTAERQNMGHTVLIDGKEFAVQWNNSPAVRELVKHLPLTLKMQDFNDNEKYGRLPFALSGQKTVPSKITSGEIMLFQDKTLVIFYEDINNPAYSYIALGHIDFGEQKNVFDGLMRENTITAVFK